MQTLKITSIASEKHPVLQQYASEAKTITYNWSVLYHSSTVYQEHNILKDFEDEIPGYLNNARIMETLQNLDLKDGEDYIFDNLITVYKTMIKHNWITDKTKLTSLEAWISDLQKIGH